MKTFFKITLILLLLQGCQTQKSNMASSSNSTMGSEEKVVVKAFNQLKNTLITHHTDSLFLALDPSYINEQHDTLLQGNTTQFVNELFCGQDKDEQFKCLNYNDIQDIKLINYTKKEGGYTVHFQATTKETTITTSLYLKVTDQNQVIGFVGGVG